jgi:hypothetical protein
MSFCHNPKTYILEVVSIRRSKITGEEETNILASR